jgi:hypothetical protein
LKKEHVVKAVQSRPTRYARAKQALQRKRKRRKRKRKRKKILKLKKRYLMEKHIIINQPMKITEKCMKFWMMKTSVTKLVIM